MKLVLVGCLVSRVAAADDLCGTGKPDRVELAVAASDPHAVVFAGMVTDVHVPPQQGFEGRSGTVEVTVSTMLHGPVQRRITVPVASEKCIPKTACPATPLDIAQKGTRVIVACIASKPPKVEIVPAEPDVAVDVKRCIALDQGGTYGLSQAFTAGKTPLARACAATIICDEHRRAAAVDGLVAALGGLTGEAALDVGLGLVQPVSASGLGCAVPPKLFRADLGGSDAANRAIAHALLEAMLADKDKDHQHRWANLVWDMFVTFYEHKDEWPKLVAKLDLPDAAKRLRKLGGPDAEHYETIAKAIETK